MQQWMARLVNGKSVVTQLTHNKLDSYGNTPSRFSDAGPGRWVAQPPAALSLLPSRPQRAAHWLPRRNGLTTATRFHRMDGYRRSSPRTTGNRAGTARPGDQRLATGIRQIQSSGTGGQGRLDQFRSADHVSAARQSRGLALLDVWVNQLHPQLPLVQGLARFVCETRFDDDRRTHAGERRRAQHAVGKAEGRRGEVRVPHRD